MKTLVYFAAFGFSLTGNAIANVVLPILVLVSTGEPLVAGEVALAGGLSTVLMGLASGPLIDRYDKRWLAFTGDLLSAASIAILPVVAWLGQLSPGWFIASAFLGGLGDMPSWNAREAMVYSVNRYSNLTLENLVGIREAVSALAIVIGPALAGLLMNYFDARTVLWCTVATSACAALLTLGAPGGRVEAGREIGSKEGRIVYWSSFRAGVNALWREGSGVLRMLTFLNVASVALVTTLQSLLIPVFMVANDAGHANGWALTAIGLGLLVGGGAYALIGTKLQAFRLAVVASMVSILSLWLLVQFYSLPLVLAGSFCFGVGAAMVGAVTGVVSIVVTPESMRGRVNSLQNTLAMIIGPFSVFAIAWLVSAVSVRAAGLCVVALWLIVNVCFFLGRSVRHSLSGAESAPVL